MNQLQKIIVFIAGIITVKCKEFDKNRNQLKSLSSDSTYMNKENNVVMSEMLPTHGLQPFRERVRTYEKSLNPNDIVYPFDSIFEEATVKNRLFIDKTLLIRDLLNSESIVHIITRPKRWGKTLNLDMLKKFFEIEVNATGYPLHEEERLNRKLFLGERVSNVTLLRPMEISYYRYFMESYHGNHPVIALSFEYVHGLTYSTMKANLLSEISYVFNQHYYLSHYYIGCETYEENEIQRKKFKRHCKKNITEEEIKNSFRFLSELLYKHFNRQVFILLDEYDTPFTEAYIINGVNSSEYHQKLENIFRDLFNSTFIDNPYMKKGVIKGVVPINKTELSLDKKYVKHYTLLNEGFSKYYGFDEEEVDYLLNMLPPPKNAMSATPRSVKENYEGYLFGGRKLFEPQGIVASITINQIPDYWLYMGPDSRHNEIVEVKNLKKDIEEIFPYDTIRRPIRRFFLFTDMKNSDGLSYLVCTGYLRAVKDNRLDDMYQLSVSNDEARMIIGKKYEEDLFYTFKGENVKSILKKLKAFEEKL